MYFTQISQCRCYQEHLLNCCSLFSCRWNLRVRLGRTHLVLWKRALLSPPLPPPSPVEEEQAVPPSTPSLVLQCLRYLWPRSPPAPPCPVRVHALPEHPMNGSESVKTKNKKKTDMGRILIVGFCYTGSATYTTSSLSTKSTSASDPPNICKVKPQQLQSSGMSSTNFSQLSCAPSLLPQQQTPQVFVSQSAAGK